jgi:hypothetical protein
METMNRPALIPALSRRTLIYLNPLVSWEKSMAAGYMMNLGPGSPIWEFRLKREVTATFNPAPPAAGLSSGFIDIDKALVDVGAVSA